MRKRNVRCQFWLNENEAERFNKLVKRSGLQREAYLRNIINGLVPADLPPPDYNAMMNELRAIGTNMNQIAQKAHVLNVIDVKRYDDAYATLKTALVDIVNAVKLPRKIERKM